MLWPARERGQPPSRLRTESRSNVCHGAPLAASSCLASAQSESGGLVSDSREELAAEVAALARLHEASTRLWRLTDLRAGLEEILKASMSLLGAVMGNVQLLNTVSGNLEISAQVGFEQPFLDCFREVSPEHDSACGRCLRHGTRIVIEDVETDAAYEPYRAVAAAAGYRAVQSTPLLGRDDVALGILSTHFRGPHRPSEQEFRRLDLYVRQAVDFIERQRTDAVRRASEERQRFLLILGDALRPLADSAAIQQTAARLLGEHLRVNQVHYGEVTSDEAVVIRQGYGDGLPPMAGTFHHSREGRGGRLLATYRAGQVAVSRDVDADRTITAAEAQAIVSAGFRAYVAVPLVKEGAWVATLAVHSIAPRDWTAAEVALVEETAERTWAAVERARAEAALRRSEQRLQRTVNVPRVGVLTFDLSGSLVGANDAFLEMVGYTRTEFAARTFSWQDFTPPEYLEESSRQFERLLTTGLAGPYEKEYFRKDGSRTWMMFVASAFGDGTMVEYAVDISDRKHAEEALRGSEVRRQLAIEAAGLGTYVWDLRESRTEADPRMMELLGLQQSDRMPDAYLMDRAIYPDDRDLYAQAVRIAIDPAGDGKLKSEFRVLHPDGSLRWIAATGYVAFEGEPREAVRIIGTAADITERKRREANLALLADVSRDLASLTNIDDTMKRLGAKICAHFHATRCAFAEVDEERQVAIVNYEWKDAAALSFKGVYRIADYETAGSVEASRAGRTYIVRDVTTDPRVNAERVARLGIGAFVGVPLVRDGVWSFILNLFAAEPRDWRTDEIDLLGELGARIWPRLEGARAEATLRESEERLRVLVQSVKDYAIFTLDPVGRVTSWNEGAHRLKGYTAHEILGQSISRFYQPDDAHIPDLDMQRALTMGRSEDESWRVRKDGSRFWANQIMTPLRSSDGRHLGFTTISRDLTERKVFEDALRRAHDELEQRVQDRIADLARANALLQNEVAERRAAEAQIKALFERLVSIQEEERRRIARNIHDQLGQQMTALRMNLEALRMWADRDPPHLEQTQRAQRLAEELDRSIDFLTWELRPAALDHLGLPAALQRLLSGWSEQFGIAVEFDLPETSGLRLPRDAEANLYRLVQEALHNIVKHAAATHVTVLLEQRDQQVVLVVDDNGRGFVLSEAQQRPDGGLGLVSMRERALLAGGVLQIETASGRGTTISVRIATNGRIDQAGPAD
jgi:PAS domain S-box-containing protein